ncbi:MAG: hypothetical protein ABI329_02560 [Candidatus Tumulicola sp.]
MEATLFLADAAQVSPDGKMHALGIGWTQTASPMSAPGAVGIILRVPWDETNRKIKWTLDLIDGDGTPVQLPSGPGNSTSLHMENEIEVGRPAGIKPGSSINVPFAVNVGPMPLPANSTFEWVLRVEGREWRTSFATRPLEA